MSRGTRFAVSLAVLLIPFGASSRAASAQAGPRPCDHAFLGGPIALGFQDGSLGAPRRACLLSEARFGGGGVVIAEPSEFYGNVRLTGALSGSFLLSQDFEIFGAVELLRYQLVIASISATELGLGHSSAGAAWRLHEGEISTFALFGRVTLPTAFGLYEHAWPVGFDFGVAASSAFSDAIELHGSWGVLSSFAISRGPLQPRAGLVLAAGVSWRVLAGLALVADLEGEVFYRAALDHVAVGAGVRFEPAEALGLELLFKVPAAGEERALAAVFLGATVGL